MKKIVLALVSTFLIPNISFAAACPTGTNTAPTDGCTIGTTGIDYTMTGNIAPASGVKGIEFTSGADNNTTTITGNISTAGAGADGLVLFNSDNNTTTMTGNITTAGGGADGLVVTASDNNTTTITGNITTAGGGADGLFLNGSDNNTTTMTGDILTKETSAFALYLFNSDNNTTMTGNITTAGNESYGLYLNSSHNNTTTMMGDITTAGTGARGLFLNNSDNNTINLHGKVTASHASATSAYFNSTSDNNTLAFGRGATLIADYYNDGTGNTLDFTNLGRAASYNYDFTIDGDDGTGLGNAFLLTDGWKTVVAGSAKSRAAADLDDAGNRLYQRFSQINTALTQQQRQTTQGQARGDYWIDSYYTDSERDTVLEEINQHSRGITAGFNASGDSNVAMDVIVNFENSDVSYGLSDQNIDSNSLIVGLSFPQLISTADGALAVKFLAGRSDNDRDLKVLIAGGDETVTDTYDSTYASVGASWMQSLHTTQRFTGQLLLGMDINHERIEGTTASKYYVLNDRDITQLVSQAQYGITIQGVNQKLQINGSIGVSHANLIGGEKQRYSVAGTAVSYSADKSNTYTTASLGASYQLTPQAQAYANVKQFDSSDDIDGNTGNVGLVVNF